MKSSQSTLAVLGIFVILLSSIALPIDDPETPYNESDIPINLAIPVAIDITANANPLHEARVMGAVVRGLPLDQDNGRMKFAKSVQRRTSGSNSSLKLLCTLIC
jgi:hypothetical protein